MAKALKETTHLRLRVDATLLAKLEKAAEKNGNTLTGEIVRRLEESFAKEDKMLELEALADKMLERFGRAVTIKEDGRVIYRRERGDDK